MKLSTAWCAYRTPTHFSLPCEPIVQSYYPKTVGGNCEW